MIKCTQALQDVFFVASVPFFVFLFVCSCICAPDGFKMSLFIRGSSSA